MIKKASVLALLAAPAFAFANPTVFSDVSLGGDNTFTFEQLQVSGGASTITVTDANGNGALDIGDTFSETGLIAGIGFTRTDGGILGAGITGLTTEYEIWATFSPLVGFISGVSLPVPAPVQSTSFTANFTAPSSVSIIYDTVIDGNFSGGTTIGVASLPSANSSCTVVQTTGPFPAVETGSCVLDFQFDAAGISAPGVWTQGGIDIGNLVGSILRVDMNVDQFEPNFFSPTFAVVGGTQEIDINHNGSAQFVPEPSSLALLGVSLLGFAGLRRRS